MNAKPRPTTSRPRRAAKAKGRTRTTSFKVRVPATRTSETSERPQTARPRVDVRANVDRPRPERAERTDRPDRFEKTARDDRPDRFERNDRFERAERTERPDRKFSADRPAPRRSNDSAPRVGRVETPRDNPRKIVTPRGNAPTRFTQQLDDAIHENNGNPEDETSDAPELIYGRQSIQAALEKGHPLNRVWVIETLRYDGRFLSLLDKAKSEGAVIDVVPRERLDYLCDGGNHQGIAAQAAAYAYWELEELITHAQKNPHPLLVVAENLEDPQNLGSLIRSCEAMGVHGLVLPQRRAVGVTATVAKVSAGALEHLPISRVVNLRQALERLKDAGFWLVGTAAQSSKTLYEADLTGPTVIVVGAEHKGISLLTQKSCDLMVNIPLPGKTPSLNAAVAGAILVYEVLRQRKGQRIMLNQTNS